MIKILNHVKARHDANKSSLKLCEFKYLKVTITLISVFFCTICRKQMSVLLRRHHEIPYVGFVDKDELAMRDKFTYLRIPSDCRLDENRLRICNRSSRRCRHIQNDDDKEFQSTSIRLYSHNWNNERVTMGVNKVRRGFLDRDRNFWLPRFR